MKNAAALVLFAACRLALPAVAGEGGGLPGLPLTAPKIARRAPPEYRELDDKQADALLKIPYQIVNCPVCRTQVRAPDLPPPPGMAFWELTARDFDADLCPHPVGRIRFHAEIVLCQHCGFAAYGQDFEKPQTREIAEWVARELTPDLRHVQASMVGLVYEAMRQNKDFAALDAELEGLFAGQETLPDILRTEHARAYYHQIGAERPLQTKLTILSAWAYRRAVAAPIEEAFLMFAVKNVLNRIGDPETLDRIDAEEQAEKLRKMLETDYARDKTAAAAKGGGWLRRQVAILMLAGLYDRLGYTEWAGGLLDLAEADHEQAARDVDPEGQNDPAGLTDDDVRLRLVTLGEMTRTRREQLRRERERLRAAANMTLETLLAGGYDGTPAEVPSRMYLVGEFARRTRDWSRALLWLEGARDCIGPGGLIEAYAPDQLRALEDYLDYAYRTRPEMIAEIRRGAAGEGRYALSKPERDLCATYVTFWRNSLTKAD